MRWWSREPGRARGPAAGQGSRMVAAGRLQRHSWTAEDGSTRSAVEVTADELHHQVVGFVKQPQAADLGLRARREGFEPPTADP
jgi:single-stranded DNA-binding protein